MKGLTPGKSSHTEGRGAVVKPMVSREAEEAKKYLPLSEQVHNLQTVSAC